MKSIKNGNKFMFFLLLYFLFLSCGVINNILLSFKCSFPMSIFLSQAIQFLIPFLIYKIITKNKFLEILYFKSLNIKNIILIIFMSLSIQPSMMFLSGISSLFFENDVPEVIEYISTFPFYLGIFSIAFTPALFEEITFRGIILKEYESINIKKAAIINGLFFGIMHLNLQQFLYATVLGIFLAYLVYYTKSIFSSMIFHFSINASQFSMSYFTLKLNSNNISQNIDKNNLITSIITIGLISVIFIPIFIFLLKKFISYNKNINFEKCKQNNTHNIKENNKKIIDIYFILIIITYILYNAYILNKK